ncbi:MAG: ferredoxin-type protein NapF [Gammaproteobacteria bacterium]|nr:ferredoxin-type protein NapF [Gammaproteobacteria bacterium]MBU1655571.1 ferredoxin-type protein NapF [Gammaproteobacteria bacterium]MBU1960268.1 ferredoxin-type protein NapF [Gammaproteobacteria bacterium]
MQTTPVDISRRNLLRGRIGILGDSRLLPPWANPVQFSAICTRCNACVDACEEGIIVQADGGFPEVDFKRGECTFCGACVDVCKPGALRRTGTGPWSLKAGVDERCLAGRGISCRSCGDVCSPRAIRFRLQTGGRAEINIVTAACTGCGACVSICPVGAVIVKAPEGGEKFRAVQGQG